MCMLDSICYFFRKSDVTDVLTVLSEENQGGPLHFIKINK